MVQVPPIFMVTGTLVADIDAEELVDPMKLVRLVERVGLPAAPLRLPARLLQGLRLPQRSLILPLEALHELGLIPSPHRLVADSAYYRLKQLGNCRVEPLVGLGLVSRQVSVDAVTRNLAEALVMAARHGIKLVAAAQSQGGLVLLEAILNLVSETELWRWIGSVDLEGVPLQGVPKLGELPLRAATVFPGVAQMKCESPSLEVLRYRMATEWPAEIPIDLQGSSDDKLVPLASSLELALPPGVEKRRYWTGSTGPLDADDAIYLAETRWLPHVGMCWGECFLARIQERRGQFTAPATPELALVA